MSATKTILICLAVLLLAATVTIYIFSTEPEAQREAATRETAMLVETTMGERGDFTPEIVATGTIQPAHEVLLGSQVSGIVQYRSSDFTPGAIVGKGQTLLRLDTAEYQNTVALRQSALTQAKADLQLEMGRQEVARKDYQLLGETLNEEDLELVLRKPQLEVAKAAIMAAEASLDQARLDLSRTVIKAPFDAQVMERRVEVGSQVNPGTVLGRLVGINTYWVAVTLPLSHLRRLTFPRTQGRGAKVTILNRSAWPEGAYREGRLYQMVGELETQTRMARILVEVSDPLALRPVSIDKPKLIIGSFVEVRIEGKALSEVVRLERDYLRKDNTVWVMEGGALNIRPVEVTFKDEIYAYISQGLTETDTVVTTNIATVVEGAPLRVDNSSGEKQDQPATFSN